jgi:hypothetical protein
MSEIAFDHRSKQFYRALLAVVVMAVMVFSLPAAVNAYSGYPQTSIVSVSKDTSVTVKITNLPPSQNFVVRMNKFGTLGVGGPIVANFDSGSGGEKTGTYTIPDFLKGEKLIAIRFEGSGGPYAYDWFTNDPAGATPAATATPKPGTTATVTKTPANIPTMSIVSVVKGEKVTIKTNNFPKNQTFTVRMGEYGTLGVNGIAVATTDSGAGGSFEATYSIPDALKSKDKIAIRMESPAGYFAYDWFNNVSGAVPTSAATATKTSTPSGTTTPYPTHVYPTFSITAVIKDGKVTVKTANLPKNQTFTVRMGAYGTLAIGGTVVGTTDSGEGGTKEFTYDIPSGLKGSQRIAIRMDSASGPYAYNWFWNSTYP